MPKLPSEAAKKATEAASNGGFAALEEGTYRCRLVEVEAKTARSSGNPMWVWKLETADPDAGSEGKFLWVNTVLTDKAMWKVAEMFAAFGADTDTDTDELIGEHCMAEVVQRKIEGGARAGQMGNDVQRCFPEEGAEPRSAGDATAPEKAAAAAEGW